MEWHGWAGTADLQSRHMTTPQPVHPSTGTPRLLREIATRTTGNVVGTVIGATAFVALGAFMITARDLFVGRRVSVLFLRFTVDQPTIIAVGAVCVLFFGFIAVLGVWELLRRNR